MNVPFLEVTERYKRYSDLKVQIVFPPHPLPKGAREI